MAHDIGYFDVFPYAAPEPEDIPDDDPVAELEWTPATTVLAALVFALCFAGVVLMS